MKLLVALALVALVGSAIARPARDLKSDLITKGQDLVKKADDAVTKLTAAKKDHEVTVVKAEEARITKLIADLTAATDDAKVKTLERELGALEARLNHELTRINQTGPTPVVNPPTDPKPDTPPSKRDAKSDLIEKANALLKKATDAETKLEADKKTRQATMLKTHIAHIQKVIADLTAATDDAKVKSLEHELTLADNRLNTELLHIASEPATPPKTPTDPATPPKTTDPVSPPANPSKRDLKADLITKGTALVVTVEAAITKLETDKKTQEAAMLKTQEAHLKKAVADLTAATDDAKIKAIEHDLNVLENRLAHELTRINGTPANPPKTPTDPANPPANPSKRDAKSDLIEKANALLKKADDAITKLGTDTTKAHEVTGLKMQETHIKKLITDLTAATDDAKVKTLEMELNGADARLNHELTRINGTPSNPPKTPTDPANPPANPSKRDAKSDLIDKATALLKKADDAITKLGTDTTKAHEVTVLKAQEAHIKKVVADLTAATDDAKVKALERELTTADNRLNTELMHIAATPVVTPPKTTDPVAPNPSKRDAKSDLTDKATALLKKADDAITKLGTDTTKAHQVTVLKTQEAHIKKLIADLTAATDDAKVKTLEHELTLADGRLNTELARINTTPVVTPPKTPTDPANPPANPSKRDAKSDLIEKANALLKKADDAVMKLETDKKTQEATMIKTQETHIKKVVADLTAATDDAKVKMLEGELNMLDARLAHELARIVPGTPVVPPKTTDPVVPPSKRDAKSDLIEKANALLKKADDAITKLGTDTTKAHQVTVLKTQEAHIKKVIADLTAATDDAKVKTLEHDLTQADGRLTTELARINATPVVTPPKTPTDPAVPPTNP